APSGKAKACIGYCYSRLKEPTPAHRYYQDAIKAGFAPAAVWNNLGYTRQQLKRFAGEDNAEVALGKALELDPRLQAVYHNRALLYKQKAEEVQILLENKKQPPGSENRVEKLKAKWDQYMRLGMADFHTALTLGSCTGDLYRNVAAHCAMLAERDPAWI